MLKVQKILTYPELPEPEQKIISEHLSGDIHLVKRIFYTNPMFAPFNENRHDIVFEVQVEEYPDFPLKNKEGMERFYAFVYNCIEPEFSEFGTVVMTLEYRIA